MFKKGDYVQSLSKDYIVLVDRVYKESFSGTVVESSYKFHKVGMTCDCWGIEFFKKIDYKPKHEESENDYHIIDFYPTTLREKILNDFSKIPCNFIFGIDYRIKEEEKMAKVRCVDDKSVHLTKNEIYQATIKKDWYTGDNIYVVMNDRGSIEEYNGDRFEIVEEQEMEREINLDDKVILRTDIAIQLPCLVEKGTIFNVDFINGNNARISNEKVSIVVALESLQKVEFEKVEKEIVLDKNKKENIKTVKYIDKIINVNLTLGKVYEVIKEDKDFYHVINDINNLSQYPKHYFELVQNKKQEIKIVRKLEDLHLQKSKSGKFKMFYNKDKNIAKIEYIDSMDMVFCEISEEDFKCYSTTINLLKELGFEFDYKPLKSEEEILIELDVFSKRFHDKHNRFVLMRKNNGLYYAREFNDDIPLGQSKWFTKDKVNKYVLELNESIGVGKK